MDSCKRSIKTYTTRATMFVLGALTSTSQATSQNGIQSLARNGSPLLDACDATAPTVEERLLSTACDRPFSLALGDFDGDGDLDVAVASDNDSSLRWFENPGFEETMAGDPWPATLIGDAFSGAFHVSAGDIDGDGRVDLLLCQRTAGVVRWIRNTDAGGGDPAFLAQPPFPTHQSGDFAYPVEAGLYDADLDVDMDVVVVDKDAGEISFWYFTGDNPSGFTPAGGIGGLDGPNNVMFVDVDQDSNMDMLVGAQYEGHLRVYEGSGPWLLFSGHGIHDAPGLWKGVDCADLDGDGHLDLIAALGAEDRIDWWPANPWVPFIFAEPFSILDLPGAYRVRAFDLEGDGDVDLVVHQSAGSELVALFNNGSGGFDERLTLSSTMQSGTDVQVAWLWDDDRPCLVACSRDDDKLAIVRLDFPDRDASGVADSCEIADGLLGDCDGDGVPDECQALAAPQLAVERLASGALQLDWTPVEGAAAYRVELAVDGGPWQTAAAVAGPAWTAPAGSWPDDAVVLARVRATAAFGVATVLLPPRTFEMGGRTVTLDTPALMGRDEFTRGELLPLLQAAYDEGRATLAGWTVMGFDQPLLDLYANQLSFVDGVFQLTSPHVGDKPVEATWFGAALCCDWLSLRESLPPYYDGDWDQTAAHDPYGHPGYRLPTEAERENAATWPDGRLYPWGEAYSTCVANVGFFDWYSGWAEPCHVGPTGVGEYAGDLSALGQRDLAGNLPEWCGDRYGPYAAEDETNPLGSADGWERCVRGAGWFDVDESGFPQGTARRGAVPTAMEMDGVVGAGGIGFRVCRSLLP